MTLHFNRRMLRYLHLVMLGVFFHLAWPSATPVQAQTREDAGLVCLVEDSPGQRAADDGSPETLIPLPSFGQTVSPSAVYRVQAIPWTLSFAFQSCDRWAFSGLSPPPFDA